MTPFSSYKATQRLRNLAHKPFDLTKQLTPERLKQFCASACGYKLLYGTERITEEVMHYLYELADESQALQKMHAMQAGRIVNRIEGYPSENRPALHTATRDFFDVPQQAPEAKEAAKMALQETEKLRDFIEKLDRENRFTNMVLIGIGGSELGPRAHYVALQPFLKPGRRVHFIGNIDPDDATLNLEAVDLSKTLIIIISKSGTTLETATNEEIARKHLERAGLNARDHMISVSIPGSPLDNPQKYRECFHVWEWIGGRYSTTSMVGGVILAFAFGFEVYWELLRGAHAMDHNALSQDKAQNLPLIGALLGIWNRNFLDHSTLAIIPYSQALARYPAHIQQLSMESQGKRIDVQGRAVDFETGPIIWGEPGTNAQHSFYQLLHQGTTIVPMELIGYEESQLEEDMVVGDSLSQQKLLANLFAQIIALATGETSDNPNRVFMGNRPTHLLLGEQLSPYALGALLSYFESKVAFQGFIWGINPFDQEGVQLGKVLAGKILERMTAPESSKAFPLGDALLNFLSSTG